MAAGSVVFVGPLRLLQNNRSAVIARCPVFVDDPDFVGSLPSFPKWWGFTSMVVEVATLIEATPVRSIEDLGLGFVLYANKDGKSLFMHASDAVEVPSNFLQDPTTPWLTHAMEQRPVEVNFRRTDMKVHWVLLLWPREGWPPHSSSFQIQVILCVCLSVASISSVYGIVLRESVIQTIRAGIESHISELTQQPTALRKVLPVVPGTDEQREVPMAW